MHHKWNELPGPVRARLARVHDEIRDAMRDELHARAKALVRLPSGTRIAEQDAQGRTIYRFRTPAPRDIHEGDSVLIRFPAIDALSGAWSCMGHVVAATTHQLVVAFGRDLGSATPANGLYVPRESAGLVALQEHLASAAAGKTAFNAEFALRSIGDHALAETINAASQESIDCSDLATRLPGFCFGQRQAIADFLAKTFAAMWGPPGTGKTRVIASGVLLRAEHDVMAESDNTNVGWPRRPRILVLAPSNLAVDEAVQRIVDLIEDTRGYREARLIRYGRGVTPGLVEAHGDFVVFDRAVRRIRSERMRRAVHAAALYEDYLDELREAEGFLHAIPHHLEDHRDDALRHVRRLARHIERLEPIVREYARRFDIAYRHTQALAHDILCSAQIVGTTIHQAMMSRQIREGHWDCIVIDECGMVPAAFAYGIAMLAHHSAWIVGDPRQLGPVVVADTPAVRRWLRRDPFAASGGVREAPDGRLDVADFVSCLDVQHRMHPDICAAIAPAYNGMLRTAPAAHMAHTTAGPSLPFSQASKRNPQPGIYLLDTTELDPWVRATPHGSRENPMHVAVVRTLVEVLDASGLLGVAGSQAGSITVISPFRAQARRIHSVLAHQFPGRSIRADTVHAYQGRESDIVVIDLTESRGLPLTSWMRAARWSDDGARLLTVSLSRARERAIVIADCGTLYEQLQSLAPRPVVYRLLRYLETWGGAIDVRQQVMSPAQALREAKRIQEGESVRRRTGTG